MSIHRMLALLVETSRRRSSAIDKHARHKIAYCLHGVNTAHVTNLVVLVQRSEFVQYSKNLQDPGHSVGH